MPPTDLTAALVTRKNLRDRLIEQFPGIEEDETALMDTLAGIDDFEEQALAVLRLAIEREAHGNALGELMDTMAGRKRRLEDGAKSLRIAVLNAMQEAGLPGIKAADMTVGIGRGKAKLIITDEAKVPDALCRIKREPDKTAIAKAYAPDDMPDWLAIGNPQPFLSIHRK